MPQKPVLYTPEKATKTLPRLRALLSELRGLRDDAVKAQDLCDVEEISSFGTTGAQAKQARERMDGFHEKLKSLEREFERKLKVFDELGCELKGLDPGLIDFYSEMEGQLVFLCWREGEESVAFWHALTAGFAGRRPLA